jgi:long-subunit fatty acid transport protein
MNKKLLSVIVAALVVSGASAQEPSSSKFGLWTGASVTKKLNSKWSLEAEGEFRTQDALNKVDRWSGSLGVNYKAFDFLKVGAGYTFLYTYNMEEWKEKYDDDELAGYNVSSSYWMPKHRFTFDVTGSQDLGRFSVSLRERLQYTHNNSKTILKNKMRFYGTTDSLFLKGTENKTVDEKDKWSLRSRLKVEYNIRHCPLTPFASYEIYNDLKDNFSYQKMRIELGGEYKLNKHQSLSLSYLYSTSGDDDEPDGHILSVDYAYKF